MKVHITRIIVIIAVLAAELTMSSCKGKKDKNTDTSTKVDSSNVVTNPPPPIDNDIVLRDQLKDATKDFPDVTATVNNGEVTLTGKISRDRLPKLMQAVQALNINKVNNNLTIN